MRERWPKDSDWAQVPLPASVVSALVVIDGCASAWLSGRLRVLSALEQAELPDRSGIGPQWHVSITAGQDRRASPGQVRRALTAFGMLKGEEDNHHPGVARHFWMPVDPSHRVDCECKETEDLVVEGDGYRWTNPKPEDGACRGCEFEASMRTKGFERPCPLHRRLRAL